MTMPSYEAVWLEEQMQIPLDELERASGLSSAEIVELVEYGVFTPQGSRPVEWRFAARSIVIGRTANRLRTNFELSPSAVALALGMIERIEELQRIVQTLEAQLPRE